MLKVLPVVIKGRVSEVCALALLDDGSDVTLIDHEIANKIGACKDQATVNLVGLNQAELGLVLNNAKFSLRGGLEKKFYPISGAFTVSNLSFPTRSLSSADIMLYPHLSKIRDLQTFSADAPRILIGQDNRHLIDAQKSFAIHH